MSEDPWSLFAEDAVTGEPQSVGATGDATVAAAALASLALSDSAEGAEKADCKPHKIPAAGEERSLVSVPYQHTMIALSRFMNEHADATITDCQKLRDSTKDETEKGAFEDFRQHLHTMHKLVLQVLPKRPTGKGAKKSVPFPVLPAAAEKSLLEAIATEASALEARAWNWMTVQGSWPHVVFRECYVMGKIARAVSEAHFGHVETAMECIDLALIMGVPGAELEEMIDAVEMGCIASSAARAAVNQVAYGDDAVSLPTIPTLLAAGSVLDIPDITSSTAIPRVRGQGSKLRKEKKKGRQSKKGGAGAGTETEEAVEDSDEILEEDAKLRAIRRVNEAGKHLTLADFRKNYIKPNKAVVICHATDGWEALHKWRNLNYLAEAYGHRTVPVEIGQHLSGFWEEKSMKFRDFIAQFIAPSVGWGWGKRFAVCANDTPGSIHPRQVGYLAQHMLFHQIPRMTEDFEIPIYAGDDVGSINSWFGTAGTVTRLHFDSYENLFTQVLGYKYVRLYAPSETPKLYPIKPITGAGSSLDDVITSQGNVSAFDVEHPNYDSHPLAKEAAYLETVLGPGDILYIPKGHWHFVKGLTPSFSINFWF
jgi:hypothetical protein